MRDLCDDMYLVISIHALLAESDPHIRSTSPGHPGISIHALLAESDQRHPQTPNHPRNFYPRSPCGERLSTSIIGFSGRVFLSTLSLRRATVNGDVLSSCFVNFYPRSPCGERRPNPVSIVIAIIISIHALLAESDNLRVVDGSKSSIISIHALLAESDVTVLGIQHKVGISIHALLAESDRSH